jgi:uncharacterized protein YbjT (DUF2867 family)
MAMVTVTGGTGVLGREVVPRLQADGHEVAVLNRRPAAPLPDGVRRLVGDLAAGRGLEMTVQGADVIVHLASRPSRPARVDVAGTMALVDAIRRDGGRPHVVYVSIVGVDRIPWPYYKRKRQVEALVTGSGLPFTIQRATQFHDLVLTGLACAAYAPVMAVPAETSCQPVDAADVADRLAQIVWSGPADGYGADLGDPQVLDAAELARQVLAAMEVRRSVRRIRLTGRVAAGFRAGHHLAADTPRGKRTWASYLEARLAAGGGEVIGLPYINKQVRIRDR